MKKYFSALFFFLMISITAAATEPYPKGSDLNIDGSILGLEFDSSTGKHKWRPVAVDENGNLKTSDGGSAIQEISVDTSNIESYLKETDGENTVTITDLINGIGTDSADIKRDVSSLAKTAQPEYFRSQRLNITPELATLVSPVIGSGGTKRIFIELRAVDENAVFYVSFGSAGTDLNGRPVKGRILINMPTSNQNLYIYHTNESNLQIQQTEGWR